jgi:L-amino acid N-acyltransferase
MNITIRIAEYQDLESIRSILNEEILNGTAVYHYEEKSRIDMEVWFDEKFQNNFPVFIAEVENQIVGFATYGAFRPHRGFQYTVEHSIYLSPNATGKGIGKTLMQALIHKAKEQNYHIILAFVDAGNENSCKFHFKLGFREVGNLKEVGFKFNQWLDLRILELNLSLK